MTRFELQYSPLIRPVKPNLPGSNHIRKSNHLQASCHWSADGPVGSHQGGPRGRAKDRGPGPGAARLVLRHGRDGRPGAARHQYRAIPARLHATMSATPATSDSRWRKNPARRRQGGLRSGGSGPLAPPVGAALKERGASYFPCPISW